VRLEDITVEVRDKNLVRRGIIRPEELDLELTDNFNNLGSWADGEVGVLFDPHRPGRDGLLRGRV
jgi:hypothetical protein